MEYKRYVIIMNQTLSDLLEDKRVAIVGPAPYLTGSGNGEFIDSYDIVLRPNQFSVPDDLKNDYGSRTDIMNHNFGTPWMPGLKEQISRNPKDFSELKVLMCTAIKSEHSEHNFLSWPETYVSNVVRNAKEVNQHKIPFHWIGIKKYHEFYSAVGCEPYTGILSIMSMLDLPIKELYVTGFDFYQGKYVYCDGYLSPLNQSRLTANSGGSHGGDCNQRQINFLSNVLPKFDVLSVDNTLANILR
jgi:hypothetical protein